MERLLKIKQWSAEIPCQTNTSKYIFFMERKLDGNCTRVLRVVLNKSWRQHSIKQRLYRRLPPTSKTIQIRSTRHAVHSWRSKGEHIFNVVQWTPSHGQARVGRPTRSYLQQLCSDIGCRRENLPRSMDDRDELRESDREICARGLSW